MKPNKYKILVVAFMLLLVLPSVIYPMVKNWADIELNENRNPTALKRGFDRFGENFEAYYNDRTPFRSRLITAYNAMLAMFAKKTVEVLPDAPVLVGDGMVILGADDWLFYTGSDSIGYYMGTNLFSADEMQAITALLVALNDALRALGKRFALQLCPNKEQIFGEYMPKAYKVQTDYKRVDRLVDYIRANSAVTVSYAKADLLAQKPNYQVYYKRDTHHNYAGAYVAYSRLAADLGLPSVPIAVFAPTAVERLGGDLDYIGGQTPIADTDYTVNYRPEITVSRPAGSGSHTDYNVHTSNSPNPQKAFIAGDSFFHWQFQYATRDFARVTSIHYGSSYPDIDLAADITEADLLILSAVERAEHGAILMFANMVLSLL